MTSFSPTLSPSYTTKIFIDICICTLRMHGFIGRRPSTYVRMCICLFVRLFQLLSFFLSFFFSFSFFAYSMQSVKHLVVLYTFTYIYIYACIHIYEGYVMFYDQTKGLFKNKRKDCSVIFPFVELFFLAFLPFFWLLANK